MKKEKTDKKDPYYMYLGNLFIVKDGIGTVSDLKYVIIRKKEHLLVKPQYFAYPGEIEVLVGSYEISIQNEGIPFLINSVRLSNLIGYKKVDSQQVCNIILENNKPEQLKKII